MKKVMIGLMFVSLTAQAQTTPTFSGILREDGAYVQAMLNINQDITLVLCNRIMDGGYCTQPQEFRRQDPALPSANRGDLHGMSIPIVPNMWDQRISVYAIRNGQVERLLTMSLNPHDNLNLVVAAYEQQLPASNPFQTTGSTVLKIIGGVFDPYQPATIFAGWEQVRIQPISPRQQGQSDSVRESVIQLDNSMLERLPPTYPLTVCQFGICQTVTVKHIPTWSDGRG